MTEIGCLVSLFGTGTPWCETAEDISFSNWAIQVFGAGGAPPETIIPTNRREDEFLTALGSRPGGEALLKPRSALDVAQPEGVKMGSGVVRLGFRHVFIPEDIKAQMETLPGKSLFGAKTHTPVRSWVVVLLDATMTSFTHDRREPHRPHPSKMRELFTASDAKRVFNACAKALEDMTFRVGQSSRPNAALLATLGRLVKMVIEPPATGGTSTDRPPSTQWNVDGSKVVRSGDIAGCPCAERSKFPCWLHYACYNIAPFTITHTTAYDKEADIIAAMFHAAKFSSTSSACAGPPQSTGPISLRG